MAKQINLTQGQVAIVDDEDYEYLSQWKWRATYDGHTGGFYAIRSEKRPSKKNVYMHRVVMNAPAGMVVDHVNHNTLDNRKSELRVITNKENLLNKKCGVVGGKSKHRNKFQARIRISGKIIHLGTFETQEESVEAYKKASQDRQH